MACSGTQEPSVRQSRAPLSGWEVSASAECAFGVAPGAPGSSHDRAFSWESMSDSLLVGGSDGTPVDSSEEFRAGRACPASASNPSILGEGYAAALSAASRAASSLLRRALCRLTAVAARHQSTPPEPKPRNMASQGVMSGHVSSASTWPTAPQPIMKEKARDRSSTGTRWEKSWKIDGRQKPSATPMHTRQRKSAEKLTRAAGAVSMVLRDHVKTAAKRSW
mmetsp:Transcript_13467/g.39736  ORF Transcript_13467/g.39736 Transcript_13467/m.39736 type:complete len:222 (+) Transcript_13467:858-1523(+)